MNEITFSKERIRNEWFDTYSWTSISYPKGLTPSDFLGFANEDLKDGATPRHLINSISNVKRALHLEVETLCQAFGLAQSKRKAKTFPQRLQFIGDCGIVKERLFRKLNEIRNFVEHEYIVPTKDQVEDFIDIVELFLEAMRMNRFRYPCEVDMIDALDDSGKFHAISLSMNFEKGVISLKILPVGIWRGETPIYKEVSVNDEDYFTWVTFILRNNS